MYRSLKNSILRHDKGFQTLNKEVKINETKISGKIPKWLTGSLFRIGPAKFEMGSDKLKHWFDGYSMVHCFSFNKGKVSYINKFLQTDVYKEAKKEGKITFRQFATDPCKEIYKKHQSHLSDNANVNVENINNHILALGETTVPVEFDPVTLETMKNKFSYDDDLNDQITTAHPIIEKGTGDILSFNVNIGSESKYKIYRIKKGTKKRKIISAIKVENPSYMHSFAATKNYIILTEMPYKTNPIELISGGKTYIETFKWDKKKGVFFIVVDKKTGNIVGKYKTSSFFVFHHINSFQKKNKIIIDAVVYEDNSVIKNFMLDRNKNFITRTSVKRYFIDLEERKVKVKTLSKEHIELPMINYEQRSEKSYKYVYGVGNNDEIFDRLTKIDIKTGKSIFWSEEKCHPGEPIFVQKPEFSGEDDGVILSLVLDKKTGTSFLLVLDAKTMKEIGRSYLSHHVPYGFHGKYYNKKMVENIKKPSKNIIKIPSKLKAMMLVGIIPFFIAFMTIPVDFRQYVTISVLLYFIFYYLILKRYGKNPSYLDIGSIISVLLFSAFSINSSYHTIIFYGIYSVIILGAIVFHFPYFTLFYSKLLVSLELQKTPQFIKINGWMSLIWGLFFVSMTLVTIFLMSDYKLQMLVPLLFMMPMFIFNKVFPDLYLKYTSSFSVQNSRKREEPLPDDILKMGAEDFIKGQCMSYDPKADPKLNASILFDFTDIKESHGIRISRINCLYEKGLNNPTLTIHVPLLVWKKISSGKLNGQEAFMKSMFTIDGDMSLLLKMSKLFKMSK